MKEAPTGIARPRGMPGSGVCEQMARAPCTHVYRYLRMYIILKLNPFSSLALQAGSLKFLVDNCFLLVACGIFSLSPFHSLSPLSLFLFLSLYMHVLPMFAE